jgi:hypothetical protein
VAGGIANLFLGVLFPITFHPHHPLKDFDNVFRVGVFENPMPEVVFPDLEPQDVLRREVAASAFVLEMMPVLLTALASCAVGFAVMPLGIAFPTSTAHSSSY